MIEKIKAALAAEKIDIWTVNETVSRSAECFFVRRHMDLKRTTDLTDYSVGVFRELYRDGVKHLGSSSVPVYPGQSEEEIRAALRGALYAAGFAVNPWYDLPSGQKEPHAPSASGFASMEPEEMARLMGGAIFAADTEKESFINSAEVFAVKSSCRVVNSNGVDVSWDTCEVNGEYVTQCLEPRDVEIHHHFSFREPDAKSLTKDVRRALSETKDRALAERPPKGGRYTVLLTGDHLREIFGYYVSRASASAVYNRYSDYAPGRDVQGDGTAGDRLTVELTAASPYDQEGLPLTDRTLMERGVLKTIHGGARFSQYLGIEPTGSYRSIRVASGETPLEEMKKRPHLRVVTFSDFQMNAMSGHFAGEIRLAYLFDGEKVTPVTGGSVNGDLLKAQKDLLLSKERYTSSTYDGPMAVLLPDVAVAGE